jgi:rubrerythrin
LDLTKYGLKDLLLTAIKSEIDSNKIYSYLEQKIENGLLKDKFSFLAKEEIKHMKFLESIYKNICNEQSINLPEKTIVPLPEIHIPENEDIQMSNILKQAMIAEQKASDFYKSLSEKFNDSEIKNMLKYFSDMETGHYLILKNEMESIERFEQSDVYWPMIHVGP